MSSQLPHALPRPPSPVAPPPPKPKEVGLLVVVVLKAQHLEDKHKFSKQDPYCVVSLSNSISEAGGTTKPDKGGGQHPVWDEEFRFPVYEGHQTLRVSVYAKESGGDDLLGNGTVELGAWPNNEFDDWVPISLEGKVRGEVFLEMTLYPIEVKATTLARRPSKMQPAERLSRPLPLPPHGGRVASSSKLQIPGDYPIAEELAGVSLEEHTPLPFPGDPEPPARPSWLQPGRHVPSTQPPTIALDQHHQQAPHSMYDRRTGSSSSTYSQAPYVDYPPQQHPSYSAPPPASPLPYSTPLSSHGPQYYSNTQSYAYAPNPTPPPLPPPNFNYRPSPQVPPQYTITSPAPASQPSYIPPAPQSTQPPPYIPPIPPRPTSSSNVTPEMPGAYRFGTTPPPRPPKHPVVQVVPAAPPLVPIKSTSPPPAFTPLPSPPRRTAVLPTPSPTPATKTSRITPVSTPTKSRVHAGQTALENRIKQEREDARFATEFDKSQSAVEEERRRKREEEDEKFAREMSAKEDGVEEERRKREEDDARLAQELADS